MLLSLNSGKAGGSLFVKAGLDSAKSSEFCPDAVGQPGVLELTVPVIHSYIGGFLQPVRTGLGSGAYELGVNLSTGNGIFSSVKVSGTAPKLERVERE